MGFSWQNMDQPIVNIESIGMKDLETKDGQLSHDFVFFERTEGMSLTAICQSHVHDLQAR